jgi:hypothetical protein
LVVKQFEASNPVGEALERLLWASGHRLATDVDRDENKEQILELDEACIPMGSALTNFCEPREGNYAILRFRRT